MTATPAVRRAIIEDLYNVEGKAEIVNGEIVTLMSTGIEPKYAGDAITVSLWNYVSRIKVGRAVGDGGGFHVDLPNRSSFSPDAAYFIGPRKGMGFFQGAPVFAAEVRSENDYGAAAERDMAAKRRDYFAAGTLVVWDVDLQSPDVVRKYTANTQEQPQVFRRGEQADAEPAVPNWTMPVDDLFFTDDV